MFTYVWRSWEPNTHCSAPPWMTRSAYCNKTNSIQVVSCNNIFRAFFWLELLNNNHNIRWIIPTTYITMLCECAMRLNNHKAPSSSLASRQFTYSSNAYIPISAPVTWVSGRDRNANVDCTRSNLYDKRALLETRPRCTRWKQLYGISD